MKKKLLISIITVNYNDAKGLEKTIKSVQSQTYKDFEHIIIDGNSNDGSKEIIENHKKSFSYWVSEVDSGIYNAMNKGIKVAKGEYLLFLNSGDHFFCDYSLNQFDTNDLKGEYYDLIYGNLKIIGNKEFIKTYPSKLSFAYFVRDTLPHPATLIKQTCFNGVFYDESLLIVSDWKFFMIGVVKNNFTYKYINSTISTFYLDGISNTKSNLALIERNSVLKNNFSSLLIDYEELRNKKNILSTNRFKMLLELERSNTAKKINSFVLRLLLRMFRGKRLKNL